MLKRLGILLLLTGTTECRFIPEKSANTGTKFYENFSGYDVKYIPIIPPFKAISSYPDVWLIGGYEGVLHLTEHTSGDIPVLSFGVSKNYIYGTVPKGYTSEIGKWFLFNTQTKLYSEYDTEAELTETLRQYKLNKNPIKTCNEYHQELIAGKPAYWFPEKGKEYPVFTDFFPDSSIEIQVTENGDGPVLKTPGKVKRSVTKIYHFRVQYNKPKSDLLYLSINSAPPVPLEDNLEIPVYAEYNSVDITVYTPYPVAQKKNISEKDRTHISKSISLSD
jgi:hypothetical protein